jgi:hypothetical protein
VLAEDQAALWIDREAVGAGLLAGERRGAGVAAGSKESGLTVALLPPEHRVLDHVGEQQVPAVAHPDRALRPAVAVRDLLEHRAGRHQPVEPGVETPHDRLMGRAGLQLSAGAGDLQADRAGDHQDPHRAQRRAPTAGAGHRVAAWIGAEGRIPGMFTRIRYRPVLAVR